MDKMPMPEVRARIGFTAIAYVAEVFPKVFYQIVPEGVLLNLLTVQHVSSSKEAMARMHEETLSHARSFARAGCDVAFLGGSPTNLSQGWDHLRTILRQLEEEFGVRVSSSATAQDKALHALGARKVGVVHPFSSTGKERHERHDEKLRGVGLTLVGCIGAGASYENYHLIPRNKAFELGVALKRQSPDLDTILFGCPHWHVTDAIEPLEQELGINVVASIQAIAWEGMRLAGIKDQANGYGRLLREF